MDDWKRLLGELGYSHQHRDITSQSEVEELARNLVRWRTYSAPPAAFHTAFTAALEFTDPIRPFFTKAMAFGYEDKTEEQFRRYLERVRSRMVELVDEVSPHAAPRHGRQVTGQEFLVAGVKIRLRGIDLHSPESVETFLGPLLAYFVKTEPRPRDFERLGTFVDVVAAMLSSPDDLGFDDNSDATVRRVLMHALPRMQSTLHAAQASR
jgi:hypothetical protein